MFPITPAGLSPSRIINQHGQWIKQNVKRRAVSGWRGCRVSSVKLVGLARSGLAWSWFCQMTHLSISAASPSRDSSHHLALSSSTDPVNPNYIPPSRNNYPHNNQPLNMADPVPPTIASVADARLPRVTIQFCTQCKWMLRAAYVSNLPLTCQPTRPDKQPNHLTCLLIVRPRTPLNILHRPRRGRPAARHGWGLRRRDHHRDCHPCRHH